jgi:DNA modification methylase
MTVYLDDGDVVLHQGDVLEQLAGLPDESVDCCVTSPPYFGLRDYGTGRWEGGDEACDHKGTPLASSKSGLRNDGRDHVGTYDGEKLRANGVPFRDVCGKCGATRIDQQIGLEDTPDTFITRLVSVFRQVRRVLAPHGTCFVNIGSSYASQDGYPISETDAAWLAGLIDGEGCIQIHRQSNRPGNSVDSFQLDLSVGMIDREPVERAHRISGVGSCQHQASGVWDWGVRGQQAARLLRAIYPWLTLKRKRAAYGIMLADDVTLQRFGRGRPATVEAMDYRQRLREAISDCNQRREPRLPFVEPTTLPCGVKAKDDLLIPHSLAIALRSDGWYLRSDIIWAKPNPMPESVRDRPTSAHEHVFLLTRQPRYWWDAEAVREPVSESTLRIHSSPAVQPRAGAWKVASNADRNGGQSPTLVNGTGRDLSGRNIRNVWTIAKEPTPDAHFATFPRELVRRCLAAGCPEGGVVLDPFVGSGTTASVARSMGRRCVGIDLNPEYLAIAARRLQQLSLLGVPCE